MGEEVRAEQRSGGAVVQPARGDQANRRLHDVERATFLSDVDRVRAGHRAHAHRPQNAATVGLGTEIEPQRCINVAGLALLHVEMRSKSLDIIDRHELVEPYSLSRSGNIDSATPRAINDSTCARSTGSSLPKPVSVSSAASLSVSR